MHRTPKGWSIEDPPGLLPLFGLSELNGAGTVYVCEGEKCVLATRRVGLCATTSAHGANSPQKTDWSPLAGKTVVILADNDTAGRDYAKVVARTLGQLGCTVKIVTLPGLPDGGDIVDFIDAHDSRDNDVLRCMIETIAAESSVWSPPAPAEATTMLTTPTDALASVPTFDPNLLPSGIRDWIIDVAERTQCPIEYPAVGAMIALASVVGRKVAIRPKQLDDWQVTPNLWGGIIGPPGVLKTPALREALKPLVRLEIEAKQAHDGNVAQFKVAEAVATATKKNAQKAIANAAENGDDPQTLAAELLGNEPHAPIRRRYLTNDPTVEKLGALLQENPNGLLVFRDELVGLLRSLDKQGQECARSFYLESWNGDGRFTFDRIGRGTLDIEACCVSIVGGIQPGPFREYLLRAMENGALDDGLVQRFQLLVWPDTSERWINVDRWPDATAKQRAFDVFTRLDTLDPLMLDATDRDDEGRMFLRFNGDAQGQFDAWRADLEHRLRSGQDSPAIEAHLAKYRSLIPTLALLIHLADGSTGSVGDDALRRAIRWGEFLESHARRIYGTVFHGANCRGDKKLIDSIRKCGSSVTSRDLQRSGPCFKTASEAQAALDVLVSEGLGVWESPKPSAKGGHPAKRFRLVDGTDTDTTRPDVSNNSGSVSVSELGAGTPPGKTPEARGIVREAEDIEMPADDRGAQNKNELDTVSAL
ncbi:MAG: DUF3987 domain-containing protein [Planctomycetes bacterium]|nr:DUF3987 domain-containing protein [Planctomycetota bacterium]